ncbi:MAG: hypothetical protein GY784_10730, partial [Gammaproteobacteria bacterium]|nr:hypothetical protein [Gammaproteobacteria bacterium]
LSSTTRINGRLALRPCFIGARAQPQHVQGLIQAIVRIGDELIAEQP